ncbi:MAG: response regulator [Anaerolineae bacterium]|nr:response regulator [Anaerolineae bacterium]MDW8298402.1 response regulator [Anaerolineae bacterium]
MSYILLAEDDRSLQFLVQRKLEQEGYTVRSIENGAEALALALKERPMLLLLDIGLPEVTGYEICRIVKRHYGVQAPPVVIISTNGQDSDVEAAEDIGADDYLIKPFSLRDLAERVRDFMNNSHVRQSYSI